MHEYQTPIVFVGEPPTFLDTNDPAEAALAGEVFFVQWQYIHGRATALDLLAYYGRRIGGRQVETDPEALIDWARRGEFDLAEVYREMFG